MLSGTGRLVPIRYPKPGSATEPQVNQIDHLFGAVEPNPQPLIASLLRRRPPARHSTPL